MFEISNKFIQKTKKRIINMFYTIKNLNNLLATLIILMIFVRNELILL